MNFQITTICFHRNKMFLGYIIEIQLTQFSAYLTVSINRIHLGKKNRSQQTTACESNLDCYLFVNSFTGLQPRPCVYTSSTVVFPLKGKLSSCDRSQMVCETINIYYQRLYRKSLLTPGLEPSWRMGLAELRKVVSRERALPSSPLLSPSPHHQQAHSATGYCGTRRMP